MITRHVVIGAAAVLAALTVQAVSARALSMTECSAKYKEAKAAGTLNGMKWNDFRKAQCGGCERRAHERRGAVRRACDRNSGKRGISERGRSQIFQGYTRQGSPGDVSRSVQG